MKKVIYIAIITITIILFFSSCANIQAPSGGPPDTTPPIVYAIELENNTINFNNDRIKLIFSKYMNRNSVLENLYIMPTTKMTHKWSGKDLQIRFEEELKENTTYSLNIGADFADLKGNKPEDAFNIIFSTSSVIDTGRITGKVFATNPQGLFIFAYNITDINPDTLNYFTTPPEYKVQIGSSGNFTINGLKDGTYRLISVLDKFKDGLISDGQDQYSTSISDAVVEYGVSKDIVFRFGKNVDFSPPTVFSAESINDKIINVYFSEQLDSTSISINQFVLIDSLSQEKIKLINAELSFDIRNIVRLISEESVNANRRLTLSISNSDKSIRDTSGVEFADSTKYVHFYSSSKIDTSYFYEVRRSIRDSAAAINPYMPISFRFSYPIKEIDNNKILFINAADSSKINFDVNFPISSKINLKPTKNLEYNSEYRIEFPIRSIIPLNSEIKYDSLISLYFKTEDNRMAGMVSGSIVDSTNCSGNLFVVLAPQNARASYFIKANSNGTWSHDNIRSGIYSIWLYCDINRNDKYDFGNLIPFEFAEPFYLTTQEINIRSRWELKDVMLYIGGGK